MFNCTSLSLYRVLIDKYPENLITEDGWGAAPILYAIWGNAPNDIIQYLGESYQSLYPNYELNWTKMMETLGKANTATEVIQKLFDVQKDSFPQHSIDWETVLEQLMGPLYVSEASFRFLVKCSITKRVNEIGLKNLRERLFDGIRTIRPIFSGRLDTRAYLDTIRSKLAEHETEYYKLKESTTIVELALWKKRMDDCGQGEERCKKKIKIEEAAGLRKQCRISCGADIVIQHVLPYIIS